MKTTLCQNCHKNPIQISYTQIFNGEREELYLCWNCAQEVQKNLSQKILKDIFSFEGNKPNPIKEQTEKNAIPEKNLKKDIANKKDIPKLNVIDSKILTLTLDKEQALAGENYQEVARINEILEKLFQEKKLK